MKVSQFSPLVEFVPCFYSVIIIDYMLLFYNFSRFFFYI